MFDFSGMFFYLAVSAFTPGPHNLMCMYLGANYGLRGSRKFITASMASVSSFSTGKTCAASGT